MTHKEIQKFASEHEQELLDLAMADDNEGLCCACGELAYCVEPDARAYTCESCGKKAVYGATELLFYLVF